MLNPQTAGASSSQYVVFDFEKDDAHVDLIEDMSSYKENDCDDDLHETTSNSSWKFSWFFIDIQD